MSAPRDRTRRLDYRLLAALYRTLLPSDAPRPPLDPAQVRRVLVVRHDAIGDMAVTLPALAYLRALLPHAEVDVVASPRNASLLAGDRRVSAVHVNDHRRRTWPRLVRALRRRRYDLVLSPIRSRGLREGLFAALVAGRRGVRATLPRQAQYVGLFTHVAPSVDPSAPIAERLLAFVHPLLRHAPATPPPTLAHWPAALRRDHDADARAAALLADRHVSSFVALNAWAAEPARLLGVALAAEIAVGLLTGDGDVGVPNDAPTDAPGRLHVLLTPPPGAEAEAAAIAAIVRERLGRDARIAAAPPGSIADLVALLRRAAFVVTPDTANVHLASAVGTPVVALYTPLTADVREWRPWNVPHRTIALTERRPLRDVPASDVLAAVASLRTELG